MSDYHEPFDELTAEARDFHRALTSLKEEIEAVDWYHQRIVACDDPSLREILAHNRDEEIEHACMTLEWLRRHMGGWDEQLRGFLFTDGPIATGELRGAPDGDEGAPSPGRGLGLGDLKGRQETMR